jgi:hypothetical protein
MEIVNLYLFLCFRRFNQMAALRNPHRITQVDVSNRIYELARFKTIEQSYVW